MKLKHISLVLLLLIVVSGSTIAQVKTQYFLTTIPQTMEMNPAIQPYSNGFAYLPGISSVQFNLSNNALSVRDAFTTHPSEPDSFVVDWDNISKKLKKSNAIDFNTNLNLLGFGFRVKELYFTFQASMHINNTFSFSEDLYNLRNGNGRNLGAENSMMVSMSDRMLSYSQIALGASRNITDSLTVGVKLKFLKGIASIIPEHLETEIYTNEDTYDIETRPDILLHLSAPIDVPVKDDEDNPGNMIVDNENIKMKDLNTSSDITDAFLMNKNSGFAIDLGGVYKLNEKITLSASIIDFGYISWKTNTTTLYNYDKNYVFDGIDVSDEIDLDKTNDDDGEEKKDPVDEIIEELLNSTKLKKNNESFVSWLPARLYLAGSYDVFEKVNVGVLGYSRFMGGNTQASLSLSTNVHPTNWFSAGLSYTMANRSFNNLGFGFSLRGGPFQFYVATDYLNTAFRWQRSRAVNMNFGLNLVFGNKKKIDHSLIDEI